MIKHKFAKISSRRTLGILLMFPIMLVLMWFFNIKQFKIFTWNIKTVAFGRLSEYYRAKATW